MINSKKTNFHNMKTNTKKSLIALVAAAIMFIPLTFAAGEPEDVTGLSATTVDEGSISLTWNATKDAAGQDVDHYRVYYGDTSVQQVGAGDYTLELDTVDSAATHVATELEADTEYFFSVTAFDALGVESEAYSLEASAKTAAEEAAAEPLEDTLAPSVTKVSAPTDTSIVIEFSEAVKLPDMLPQSAFSITEQMNPSVSLEVTKASLDSADTENKTVNLETAAQTVLKDYIVVVGAAVTDEVGNSMLTSETDSGMFTGPEAAAEPEAPAEVPVEPVVVDPIAEPAVEPIVEPVVIEPVVEPVVEPTVEEPTVKTCEDEDCINASFLTCEDATYTKDKTEKNVEEKDEDTCVYKEKLNQNAYQFQEMTCELPKADLDASKAESVDEFFTVENPQTADEMVTKYEQYCTGSLLTKIIREVKATFVDTTPPEDVTNLMLSFKKELEKYNVMLKWTASLNTAKDLVDQVLYQSENRGKKYAPGKSLGPTSTNTDVEGLVEGREYTFKLTTKDSSGNESIGVVKSLRLPQTGLGVGLILMGSSVMAGYALRRKRK